MPIPTVPPAPLSPADREVIAQLAALVLMGQQHASVTDDVIQQAVHTAVRIVNAVAELP